MTAPYMTASAEAAGLSLALSQFPEDVAAAFRTAATLCSALAGPTDPRAEPWPPMRTATAL